MNKAARVPRAGRRGDLQAGNVAATVGGGMEGPERRPAPRRRSRTKATKGEPETGLLGKAASARCPFRGHKGKLSFSLRLQDPKGPSRPWGSGTRGGGHGRGHVGSAP